MTVDIGPETLFCPEQVTDWGGAGVIMKKVA